MGKKKQAAPQASLKARMIGKASANLKPAGKLKLKSANGNGDHATKKSVKPALGKIATPNVKSAPSTAPAGSVRKLKVGVLKVKLKRPVKPAKKLKPAAPAIPVVAAPAPVPAAPPAPVDQRGPEPTPMQFVDRGQPIPDAYGLDRLVALVRDPQWIYGYWELTGGLMSRIQYERGQGLIDASAWVLRLHRISEDCAVDIEIDPSVGNWYIHVGKPGRYQLELGLLTPEGEWISLLASNELETPAEGISDRIDEEWRLRPEDEERLRQMLLKELGLVDGPETRKRRGASEFAGGSRMLSSWKLAGSWLGGSSGGSASGRPVAGSWMHSFQGASGRPSSGGSGGFMNVGWIVGADGRHEPVLVRPGRGGGPNWNFQPNLPRKAASKTDAPHFSVKLPRLLKHVPRPKPTWPPRVALTPPPRAAGKSAPVRPATPGSSGRR